MPVRSSNRARSDGARSSAQPVYDLINCGPRHCFTVWAGEAPLIVHNCENFVQASARDCLRDAMLKIDALVPDSIVFHVHDEIVMEVPVGAAEATLDTALKVMAETPSWAPGLPLKGAGYITPYYLKD